MEKETGMMSSCDNNLKATVENERRGKGYRRRHMTIGTIDFPNMPEGSIEIVACCVSRFPQITALCAHSRYHISQMFARELMI